MPSIDTADLSSRQAALSLDQFQAFHPDLLPVIPPDAKLTATTSISPEMRGKTPGYSEQNGEWHSYPWQHTQSTPELLAGWLAMGAGIGLIGRRFPGLDIDLDDEQFAALVRNYAFSLFGPAPSRTRGTTRTLLLYRGDNVRKHRVAFTNKQAVEILGEGQYFNLAGQHPSGSPYVWDETPDLATLSIITDAAADAFITAVGEMGLDEGWEIKNSTSTEWRAARKPPSTPTASHNNTPSDVDIHDDAIAAVKALQNDTDNEEWFKVARALYTATCGSAAGREAWEAFCSRWTLGTTPDARVASEWIRGGSDKSAAECCAMLIRRILDQDPTWRSPSALRHITQAEHALDETSAETLARWSETLSVTPDTDQSRTSKTARPELRVAVDNTAKQEAPKAAPDPDPSDLWRAGIITSKAKKGLGLDRNVDRLLTTVGRFNFTFDEFTGITYIVGATPWNPQTDARKWSEVDDYELLLWVQRKDVLTDLATVQRSVSAIARRSAFHPIRDYLGSPVWDRQPRVDTWLSTYLGSPDNAYSRGIGSRWLIAAVARVYEPGCKCDCALILVGDQGIGKSTALSTLAHPWFTDEIADLGSKDSAMQTARVWIIELGELDAMSRGEMSRVKAFMSRRVDRFRPPYGRRVIEEPRQSILAGSSNEETFLRDATGARRFWTIACASIDIRALERDRDQLWAEAVHRYNAGEPWWIDDPELEALAAAEQAERFEPGLYDDEIARYLDAKTVEWSEDGWGTEHKRIFLRNDVTAGEIHDAIVPHHPDSKPVRNHAIMNSIGRYMTHLGWKKKSIRTPDGQTSKRFVRPPKKLTTTDHKPTTGIAVDPDDSL